MKHSEGKPGFILGGSHGMIVFYEIELKTMRVVSGLCFSAEERSIVQSLAASSNESYVSIVSQNEKGEFLYSVLNTYQIDADDDALLPFFGSNPASSPGYHHKRVVNISCALMKSLFATCSKDQTVKLWNY